MECFCCLHFWRRGDIAIPISWPCSFSSSSSYSYSFCSTIFITICLHHSIKSLISIFLQRCAFDQKICSCSVSKKERQGAHVLLYFAFYDAGLRHTLHSNNGLYIWSGAIAHWICLHLPSCRPWFESQAHYVCFNHL